MPVASRTTATSCSPSPTSLPSAISEPRLKLRLEKRALAARAVVVVTPSTNTSERIVISLRRIIVRSFHIHSTPSGTHVRAVDNRLSHIPIALHVGASAQHGSAPEDSGQVPQGQVGLWSDPANAIPAMLRID